MRLILHHRVVSTTDRRCKVGSLSINRCWLIADNNNCDAIIASTSSQSNTDNNNHNTNATQSEGDEYSEYDRLDDATSDKYVVRSKVCLLRYFDDDLFASFLSFIWLSPTCRWKHGNNVRASIVNTIGMTTCNSCHRQTIIIYRILVTIALFYGLPVVQLVLTWQNSVRLSGDLDLCWYNFRCARSLFGLFAFNSIFRWYCCAYYHIDRCLATLVMCCSVYCSLWWWKNERYDIEEWLQLSHRHKSTTTAPMMSVVDSSTIRYVPSQSTHTHPSAVAAIWNSYAQWSDVCDRNCNCNGRCTKCELSRLSERV